MCLWASVELLLIYTCQRSELGLPFQTTLKEWWLKLKCLAMRYIDPFYTSSFVWVKVGNGRKSLPFDSCSLAAFKLVDSFSCFLPGFSWRAESSWGMALHCELHIVKAAKLLDQYKRKVESFLQPHPWNFLIANPSCQASHQSFWMEEITPHYPAVCQDHRTSVSVTLDSWASSWNFWVDRCRAVSSDWLEKSDQKKNKNLGCLLIPQMNATVIALRAT